MNTDQQKHIEDARQLCMGPLMRCQWAIEELHKHPGWCFIKLGRARPDEDVITEVIWFGENSMAQTAPAENAWQVEQLKIRAAAIGRRMKVNVMSEDTATPYPLTPRSRLQCRLRGLYGPPGGMSWRERNRTIPTT